MNTYVAIEQTRSSLLAAVAETRATRVELVDCVRVDLPDGADVTAIESALRSALPSVRWTKVKLTVVVGGDNAQLRRLDLPPAPAEELPAMVRMLSAKELGAADEDAIDYMPIGGDEHGNHVIAARLAESRLTESQELAKRLDASLEHVVLRPCAAAALIKRLAREVAHGPRLIVAPASGGADLVALRDGEPVLIRSTRGASEETVQADIRRTLPVASQQLGGPPASITVVGSPAEETMHQTPAGDIDVRVIDLGRESSVSSVLDKFSQEQRAPFIGVIGAAFEGADSHPPAVDFANPRRAESGAPDRRRQVLLAAVAAVAVLAGIATAYGRLVSLDRQIADFKASIARSDESTETLEPYEKQVAQLDAWSRTDVTWLDEIEQLGRRLRPNTLATKDYLAEEDVYLTNLQLNQPRDGGEGGQIEFQAVARSPSVPGIVEQRLSDEQHSVQPISVSERPAEGEYDSTFKTFVRVTKRPTKPAEAETPAAGDNGGEEGADE